MADSNILSDFGIKILEQEIDDVIFQTNEFLCDATFTGSQGPFWWLLVVAVTNSPKHDFNRCKSTTCKFFSQIFIRRELYILYTSILFRSFSFMTFTSCSFEIDLHQFLYTCCSLR